MWKLRWTNELKISWYTSVSFQGQCLNLRHFIKLSSFILEGYRVRAVSLVIVNEEVANNPYITFKANTRTKSSRHAKLNLWPSNPK
jgi:hypothetical protein